MGSWFRAPDNPSNAAGPREPGQPSPVRPMESGGPGAKTACVASSFRGALGLWFAARGEFLFAECSCQKIVWGRRCEGASALSGRAGSGGMAGAWAQKASRAQSCFPTKENPWGVGFGHRRSPAKQQGPRSQSSPAPVRSMESGGPGAKTACVAFLIRGALGLWFAARGEFPFAECSCQKIVWGRRCDGASVLRGRAGSGGKIGRAHV